jgi:hypothetical protein
MRERRFLLLRLSAAAIALCPLVAGCSHNASSDFEGKSRDQQMQMLRGTSNMTPDLQRTLAARSQAIGAAQAAARNRPAASVGIGVPGRH